MMNRAAPNSGTHFAPAIARIAVAMVIIFCEAGYAQSAPSSPASNPTVKLPEFDAVSIKPNKSGAGPPTLHFTGDGVSIENASLLMIIRAAYGMFNSLDDKFIGIPDWAKVEKFDIEAKVNGADARVFQKLNFDNRQLMVQAMLTDRFKLRSHHEIREQPVYDLVIAKNGPKLREAKPAEGSDPGGTMERKPGQMTAKNVVVSQLVTALTQTLGRTVVDKTEGLKGKYDFMLTWSPDEAGASAPSDDNPAPPDPTGPSIFTAIQEQLGLKLEPTKGPVECLVIDHLEQPSEN
jgi:uncharacterized protein (TIGR03435 family)